jgi:hypothetical protein
MKITAFFAHGAPKFPFIPIAGAWLLWMAPAWADQWSAIPAVQFRTEYDDNRSLTTDSPVSVWAATVSPWLDLSRATPTSSTDVGARLVFNRYSDENVRDTDVQFVTLDQRIKTRLNRFGLDGSYKRDTVFSTISEAAETDETGGLDEAPDAVDLNLVSVEVRRNRLALQPTWTRLLTERTSLNLQYEFRNVDYENRGTFLVDYRDQSAAVSLAYELTERDRLELGIDGDLYDAPDSNRESDNYGVQVNLGHAFSRTLRGMFALGARATSFEIDGERGKSRGLLFDASLIKQESTAMSYRLSAQRSVLPSGVGALVQSDIIRATVTRRLSPRLSVSLRASALKSESLSVDRGPVNRFYYNIEPGFRWRVTRLWTIDGSYRHRAQKYEETDETAVGNAVFLSVNYAWPAIATSR